MSAGITSCIYSLILQNSRVTPPLYSQQISTTLPGNHNSLLILRCEANIEG